MPAQGTGETFLRALFQIKQPLSSPPTKLVLGPGDEHPLPQAVDTRQQQVLGSWRHIGDVASRVTALQPISTTCAEPCSAWSTGIKFRHLPPCPRRESQETSWDPPDGLNEEDVPLFDKEDEDFLRPEDEEAHEEEQAAIESLAAEPAAQAAGSGGLAASPAHAAAHLVLHESVEDPALEAMIASFPTSLPAAFQQWHDTDVVPCTLGPSSGASGGSWVERHTESRGTGKGDVFYVHTVTGATSWSKPEGVVSQAEREATLECEELVEEACGIAEEEGVWEALRATGLPDSDDILHGLGALQTGGGNVSALTRAVAAGVELASAVGEDEEWQAAAARDDFALPRLLLSLWQVTAPPLLCTRTAQFLYLLGQVEPEVLSGCWDGRWGWEVDDAIAASSSGLWNAITGAKFAPCTVCWPPRLGGAEVKSAVPGTSPGVDAHSAATWLMFLATILQQISQSSATLAVETQCACIAVLLEAAAVVPWTVPIRIAWVDALAALLSLQSSDFDVILAAAVGDARGQNLIDGALAVLSNRADFGGEDDVRVPETSLSTAVQLLCHLLQRPSTAGVLMGADVRVIADICLRELVDLGPESHLRVEYLLLLKALLGSRRLDLAGAGGAVYRQADIASCLKAILEDGSIEGEVGDAVKDAAAALTAENEHLWDEV